MVLGPSTTLSNSIHLAETPGETVSTFYGFPCSSANEEEIENFQYFKAVNQAQRANQKLKK
jgi:hypothetical protein